MKRKINPKFWYIVDLRHQTRDNSYYLLNHSFKTKKEAKRILEKNIKDNTVYFDVIQGSEAIEFKFRFREETADGMTYLDYLRKYDYPPELETMQQKKSFRTKYRRWKRDFKVELKNGFV